MSYSPKQFKTAIAGLERAVKTLVEMPIPDNDGEVADALGDIRRIETKLAEYRRGLRAETPEAEGTRYKLETKRRARRSFNLHRIILDLQKQMAKTDDYPATAWDAVQVLMASNAAKLTIRWTDLKKLFALWDVTLITASHEVEDGDEAHVGEMWESYEVSVPIKEEG